MRPGTLSYPLSLFPPIFNTVWTMTQSIRWSLITCSLLRDSRSESGIVDLIKRVLKMDLLGGDVI